MSEEISIRLLGPSHMPDVQALWLEAGLPFHAEGRDTLTRMSAEAASSETFYAGAFRDGEMVACVLGTSDGRKGWINRLAVRPGTRRAGLGRALVRFCEEEFERRGAGLVCALVEEWNGPSMALFETDGYAKRTDIFYYRKSLKGEDW